MTEKTDPDCVSHNISISRFVQLHNCFTPCGFKKIKRKVFTNVYPLSDVLSRFFKTNLRLK